MYGFLMKKNPKFGNGYKIFNIASSILVNRKECKPSVVILYGVIDQCFWLDGLILCLI